MLQESPGHSPPSVCRCYDQVANACLPVFDFQHQRQVPQNFGALGRYPETIAALPGTQQFLGREEWLDLLTARQPHLAEVHPPFTISMQLFHLPGCIGLVAGVQLQASLPVIVAS